jgi:hypothetical protein
MALPLLVGCCHRIDSKNLSASVNVAELNALLAKEQLMVTGA